MTDEQRIPRPKPDYRLEEMDNELLLYHPAQTKTIYLNETASLVWQLCDGVRTEDEIVELLREAFPDAGETISEDVRRTLSHFVEHGAVDYA